MAREQVLVRRTESKSRMSRADIARERAEGDEGPVLTVADP